MIEKEYFYFIAFLLCVAVLFGSLQYLVKKMLLDDLHWYKNECEYWKQMSEYWRDLCETYQQTTKTDTEKPGE